MKILIVDDHAVVRAGIRSILSDVSSGYEISDAANCEEAMRLLRDQSFNLVLLDISLPDKNGIEFLKIIKRNWKDLPVLMLSIYPEDQYAVRAIRSGASGYMTKESAPDELIHAIQKIRSGRRYISQELADTLASALDEVTDKLPHEMLSDREYAVLCGIASGKSVTDLANEMALSTKTVSTYRARLLKKLNMKHNAELTHYAIKQKLID